MNVGEMRRLGLQFTINRINPSKETLFTEIECSGRVRSPHIGWVDTDKPQELSKPETGERRCNWTSGETSMRQSGHATVCSAVYDDMKHLWCSKSISIHLQSNCGIVLIAVL